MKSIEKLRELAADINSTEIIDHLDVVGKFMFRSEWLDSWHKAFDAACGRIEAEIAERYMELPTDADGVSIHVGDELCGYGRLNGGVTVSAVTGWGGIIVTDKGMTCNPAKNGLLWDGQVCRHYKPRTLEDVLQSAGVSIAAIDDVAAEIRELLGVDV